MSHVQVPLVFEFDVLFTQKSLSSFSRINVFSVTNFGLKTQDKIHLFIDPVIKHTLCSIIVNKMHLVTFLTESIDQVVRETVKH